MTPQWRLLLLVGLMLIAFVAFVRENWSLGYASNSASNSDSRQAPEGLYGPVKTGTTIPLQPGKHRVLVTGAAGFIGMSLSARLGKERIDVVGLDDFNAYYSTDLKRARTKHLRDAHGINVLNGNICNRSMVSGLLEEHRISHVVHLAAQPGVRYSFSHPMIYVEKNVECFVELLEAIVTVPKEFRPYLVYASSSSVYGMNTKIPFSEVDPVNLPSNLYGATKRSNEQIAVSYHNLYGVRSVGCRFFTVYGPWGRPDMAVYKFADKISKGLPIPIYNGGKMKRDFTYIDDIVAGILAIMSWRDADGVPQVFNLGNHEPVELKQFIRELEMALGKNATLKDAGSSPGEVAATFADVSLANKILGFEPKTSLAEGLKRFVSWYTSEIHQPGFAKISS